MRLLTTRSVLALLGLALAVLLVARASAKMPQYFVSVGPGVPQVPNDAGYTYYYSVWGEPKVRENSPPEAPEYDYRAVSVGPVELPADPSVYRIDGSAPPAETSGINVFEPQGSK